MSEIESTAQDQTTQPEINIERIYVKDLSFESPNAPLVFQDKWEPKIQLDINSRSRAIAEEHHEVTLNITVKGTNNDDQVLFIIEVQQAGIFKLTGLDQDLQKRIVSTMCPSILFPYARETIDTLSVKGYLPPLALAPVNFEALYESAVAQQQAEQDNTSTIN